MQCRLCRMLKTEIFFLNSVGLVHKNENKIFATKKPQVYKDLTELLEFPQKFHNAGKIPIRQFVQFHFAWN